MFKKQMDFIISYIQTFIVITFLMRQDFLLFILIIEGTAVTQKSNVERRSTRILTKEREPILKLIYKIIYIFTRIAYLFHEIESAIFWYTYDMKYKKLSMKMYANFPK